MFAFLLSVHILCAIVGLGPTFAFAFLGIISQKNPGSARAIQQAVLLISTRLVIPLALILGLSGVFLITNQHIKLDKNPWLGAGIILYLLVLGAALFYQVPNERKIIALLPEAGGPPSDPPTLKKLVNGQRVVGTAMGVAVLVIVVLMVWKPGAGA
jgi:uncharacterized membrane protein